MNHSLRKTNWKYGGKGCYFITINCFKKGKFFGRVENGEMIYSELGAIAKNLWPLVMKQFPFISIDEFQVMPDHIHALVVIEKNQKLDMEKVRKGQGGWAGAKSPMIYHNLSRVVRWYKGKCTFECRKIDSGFKWQSTFHDSILSGPKDITAVRRYIQNNPLDWEIKNPSK